MKNFSFKKVKHVGKYAWLQEEEHEIKIGRLKIGSISEASKHSKIEFKERFSINFAIVDLNEKAKFRWVCLKARFENAEDIKTFLTLNYEKLIATYNFHKFEKE